MPPASAHSHWNAPCLAFAKDFPMLGPLHKVFARSSVWAITILLTGTGLAEAEDVFFFRSVGELTITEGRLPMGAEGRFADRDQGIAFTADWQLHTARGPYASLDLPGEIYLVYYPKRGGIGGQQLPGADLNDLFHDDVVAIRLSAKPAPSDVTGPAWSSPPKTTTRWSWSRSRRPYQPPRIRITPARCSRRQSSGISSDSSLATLPAMLGFAIKSSKLASCHRKPTKNARRVFIGSARPNPSNELEQTYSLFSGGRAVSEDLQLDRPLPAAANAGPITPSDKPVKLDTLTGITVAEIDWKERIAGKTPLLDPLAEHIPADQHALFLPSLKAAQTVLGEFLGGITPILNLSGSSGIDPRFVPGTLRAAQLGVSVADMVRLADGGSGRQKRMAVTGVGPVFRDRNRPGHPVRDR